MTINYPHQYHAEFVAFVHNRELTKKEEMPGRLHFECDSWMLPGSGIAWRLEPSESVLPLREYIEQHPCIRVDEPAAKPGTLLPPAATA